MPMKNLFVFVLVMFIGSCAENHKSAEADNLFLSSIPDLTFFNSNNILKSDTVILIAKNDTMASYIYDSLGRFTLYKYMKMWSRREHLKYFDKTDFPIFKFIRVDYSLSYLSSLAKINNDTIMSYWYYEFGEIVDTFQYVFKDNKINEITSSSLNDYEKLKLKKIFYYDRNNLIKIVSLPVWGEKSGFGKIDSVIALYNYNEGKVSEIKENFYFRNNSYNYKNQYFFDGKGYPVKFIEKDTIQYKISR